METKKAFDQLAYHLIYPAVLGSIIFDLMDPFRAFSPIRFIGLTIGLCFIVDYLHMTLNLCKNGGSPHKYGAVIDIIIAFLFCASYFAIARTTSPKFNSGDLKFYLFCSGLFLGMAQLIIIIYELPIEGVKGVFNNSIPFVVSIIGLVTLFLSPDEHATMILQLTISMILITYTYRVIRDSRKKV